MEWSELVPGDDPRLSLTPGAASAFAALGVAVWSGAPRGLLALSRARIAQLLYAADSEEDAEAGGARRAAGGAAGLADVAVFDTTARAALAFTEQFVLDVSSRFRHPTSGPGGLPPPEQLGAFVMGLFFCDYDLRHTMVLSKLFDGAHLARAPVPPDGVRHQRLNAGGVGGTGPDAGECFNALLRTIALMDRIDPVTTELVRLKGARTHNCRICQSTRSVTAISQGADETMFDKVGRPEESDLSVRHRTALRLTGAMVTQPSSIAADLVDEVRREFSPLETLELVYDVVRNSSQKAAVAMAADAPRVQRGHDYFAIDEQGDVQFGLPTPLAVGRR